MLYSTLPYIIYRDYPEYGYLTDNRNFGYDTASKSSKKVGDRIVSKTGSIFYSVLSNHPQSLDALIQRIHTIFPAVPEAELTKDAESFYSELSKDGFINICRTKQDPIDHASYFSYQNTDPLELIDLDTPHDLTKSLVWGEEYRLQRIHIDISGFCNEHCIHCYIPSKCKSGLMSKEMFMDILAQCVNSNILNITISGGEPMMNPHLPFFIEKCREHNLSINILSNLTLLTSSLLQEFVNTPLLSVQTSLYSMDPNVHDSITNVKGSFIKTKHAIELLHLNNIPMQINCPIMKQNIDTYNDVVKWARSMNIEASGDYMLFGSYDCSKSNLKCRLSIDLLKKIISSASIKDKSMISNEENNIEDTKICPVCANSICISHTGDYYPCEGWQNLILGNIKVCTINEVWNSSPLVTELRNITYKSFPKCLSCADRNYCSICLIRNANESNNGDCRDINPYFCQIAKVKREQYENKE